MLFANAKLNPTPDAIVGFWHMNRVAYEGYNDRMIGSLLFRKDGTGVFKYSWRGGRDLDLREGKATDFNWHYVGGGVWRTTGAYKTSFMLSGDNLLQTGSIHTRYVYGRADNL
jgi:hypothetical protein